MFLSCIQSLLRGPCAYPARTTEASAFCKRYAKTSLQYIVHSQRVTPHVCPAEHRGYASTNEGATSHLTDLRHPALWYPAARALRRTIICHLGPTNSGKTHSALEALKTAPTGLYCGPLRLLACEVADRLNAGGLPCDLLTGQEQRAVRGARHAACTVEMAAVGTDAGAKTYDVAVIDEIQMLGDKNRGWAWSRALLGIRALTVHVCGDPGALPLLEQLARDCGDVLQVHHYQRLSPLIVSGNALGCLSQVQPGDALVAFSRRAVYGLQREVLRRSPWATPSLVYGALPPDARRHQAAAFNNRETRCHVLVASDAIGMGLNLAIQRVIFTSMVKYDGREVRSLTPSEVRQIAGRAGRFKVPGRNVHGNKHSSTKHRNPTQAHHLHTATYASSGDSKHTNNSAGISAATGHLFHTSVRQCSNTRHESQGNTSPVPVQAGYVTCLHEQDLDALHAALQEPPSVIAQACLLPRIEDIALFYTELNKMQPAATTAGWASDTATVKDGHSSSSATCNSQNKHHRGHNRQLATPLDQALMNYMNKAKLSSHYMLADMAPVLRIAQLLSGAVSDELSVTELLTFCMAPADVSNAGVAAALLRYVALYIEDGSVPVSAARVSVAEDHIPITDEQLKHLEECHAVLDLYVWLSYRMPTAFRDLMRAQEIRNSLATRITQGLEHLAMFRHERRVHGEHYPDDDHRHGSRERKERGMKEYEREAREYSQQHRYEVKHARSDQGRASRHHSRSRREKQKRERRHSTKQRRDEDYRQEGDGSDEESNVHAYGMSSRASHTQHRTSHAQHQDTHGQVDEQVDRNTGMMREPHAAQRTLHDADDTSNGMHATQDHAVDPSDSAAGNYIDGSRGNEYQHVTTPHLDRDDEGVRSSGGTNKRLPARIRKKLSLRRS